MPRHRLLFKDEPFTADDWHRLRSWKRHLPNFTFVFVLRGYLFWVVYFTFLSFLWAAYQQWLVPAGAPRWPPEDRRGQVWQAQSLTSFALSLLMIFRTNSAYARFWEARTAWGLIIALTRNLARRASAWFPAEERAALQMVGRLTEAAALALRMHLLQAERDCNSAPVDLPGDFQASARGARLRMRRAPSTAAQGVLTKDEAAWVLAWQHRPDGVAQLLGATLNGVRGLGAYQRVALDDLVGEYVRLMGACERIERTAIPQAYTRHLSRFLMIWLTLLPVPLWDVYGWAAPGLQAIISFLLIGVENIGIQIEEPFAILPLAAYCTAIQRDVREIVARGEGGHKLVARARSQPPVQRMPVPEPAPDNAVEYVTIRTP